MSYKSTAILWPVFFIALCWYSRIIRVEATLPKQTYIKEAAECLHKYMGENFAPDSLKGNMEYDEFLGEFCKEEDMNKIEKKITDDKEGHGEEVRECLRDLKLEHIYDQFYQAGEDEIEKAEEKEDGALIRRAPDENVSNLPDEMEVTGPADDNDDDDVMAASVDSDKTDKPPESRAQSPEWSPIRNEIGPVATRASQPSESKDQKEPVVQPIDASVSKQDQSDNLPGEDFVPLRKMKFSSLTKFSLGLCFDVQRVNFNELEDKEEIKVTFDCLEKCTARFFNRVTSIIDEARTKVIVTLEEREKELLLKQSIADGNDVQPVEKKTDVNATDKEQNTPTTLDTPDPDETIRKAAKKKKRIDPKEFHKEIEEFKNKSNIKASEFTNTFTQAVQTNFRELTASAQVLASDERPMELKNVDLLTKTGKDFLVYYSEYFNRVNEYLKEDDIAPDENMPLPPAGESQQPDNDDKKEEKKIETVKTKLRNSFFLYTNCARRRCYMKSKTSIPMDEYIHNEATGPDNDLDSRPEPVERAITPLQRFFKILTGKYSPDDDSSSSSSSEEEE